MSWGRKSLLFLGLVATLNVAGCSAEQGPVECRASGSSMGTTWTVRVVAPPGWEDVRVEETVQAVLDRVDDAMSTWKEDSELSRFNRARLGADDWFTVSGLTAEVVARALHWWRESDGAFDVTVAPLVELWGFGRSAPASPPEPDVIEAAMNQIGSQHLSVRLDPPALRKAVPGLSLDLSAIAKGAAVDLVSEHLSELGCSAAMVEVGGEVRCSGTKLDGAVWSIGIEAPRAEVRRLDRVVTLADHSLASSGDYRNFILVDGQRMSHTLDPRSGRPSQHRLAGVSVIGPVCADADAQCTALMVLGPEEGYAWAVAQDLAARLVLRDGDSFTVRCTPRFSRTHGED